MLYNENTDAKITQVSLVFYANTLAYITLLNAFMSIHLKKETKAAVRVNSTESGGKRSSTLRHALHPGNVLKM